mmetsp:Transcript_34641/g.60922  ORF Transcript_34641/g.60922 Transcript_34641/m.60922 type:complete len:274 (-) Transcript_34641:403-1224(-)
MSGVASKVIQRLDKRMAKFIVSTPEPKFSKARLPNVKLQPIMKNQAEIIKIKDVSMISNHTDPLATSRLSTLSTTKSTDSLIHTSQKDLSQVIKRERANKRKAARLHWKIFAARSIEELPNMFDVRRFTLNLTIRRVKRAVVLIENNWRRMKALRMIKAAMKGYQDRKHWELASKSASTIQSKVRTCLEMSKLAKVKNSARLITAYWRLRFFKLNQAALKIQTNYRRHRVYKVYNTRITSALQDKKHQLFMQQQTRLVQDRKKRGSAVKTIER